MIVRFIGDAAGYRLDTASSLHVATNLDSVRWVQAYVGRSDRLVWIDVSKAYLIEEET